MLSQKEKQSAMAYLDSNYEYEMIEENKNYWIDIMLTNDLLPAHAKGYQKELEAYGFEFKSALPAEFKYEDKFFCAAKLPPGWKKITEGIDRRHMYLIDENGRKQAYMFVSLGGYDNFTTFYFPWQCSHPAGKRRTSSYSSTVCDACGEEIPFSYSNPEHQAAPFLATDKPS